MARHVITKTSFVDGLRCPKLPWLNRYAPSEAASPTRDEERRSAQGHEVGALARDHFAPGLLVPSDRYDVSTPVDATRDAIERGETTLFEAAFAAGDVLAIVDVLQRDSMEPETWNLVEVKATTSRKGRHLPDAAFQAYVLEATGRRVNTVSIVHLNAAFRASHDESPFVRDDVSDLVQNLDVVGALDAHRRHTASNDPPAVSIGSHCNHPSPCRFKAHCWEPYGTRTIFNVPKPIHHTRRDMLIAANQIRLEDVDRDLLTESERAGVDLILNRRAHIDTDAIARALDGLTHPLHFLDFEAIDDAVPRHAGTRPYQHVPFQFSLHVLSEDGTLRHYEYLHEGASDPRPPLIHRLLESIGPVGTVVAYHDAYERKILAELARDFPHFASELRAVTERLWDQRSIFNEAYIDHRFEGKSSIKKVLPVLCPDLTYEGMQVSNGVEAMAMWDDVVQRRCDDRDRALQALRDYCCQDTMAMVRIHEALRTVVARSA